MVRYFLNLTGDKVNNPDQITVTRQYAQILFNSIVHDKVFLLPLWMPIIKVCSVIVVLIKLNIDLIIIFFRL